MDDKRLDELLSDLKRNYDTLPEYTKTENIMNELPKKKPKKPRFRGLPLVAIVAGIFLFSILALPQIGEYQQADESVGEGNQLEGDDIGAYAEKKKEAFRKALGVNSVEHFREVQHIEDMVLEKENYSLTDEDIIASIDDIYTTPKQLIEEMENMTGEERYNQWLYLIQKFIYLGISFSEYLEVLMDDLSLNVHEQSDIASNQYNYKGPIEIVEFLQMIHNHGYFIERTGNYNEVRHDYGYLVDEIEYSKEDEGIKRYFNFIAKETNMQNYDLANSTIEVPWYEADDILLEIEDIYRSYPEFRELYRYYGSTLHAASEYLKFYIHGGYSSPNDKVHEQLMEELRYFTKNHQDSIFWPLISQALKKYEAGDVDLEYSIEAYSTDFLFNNVESELSYDGLHNFYIWPILETTETDFRNYDREEDTQILTEMSPMEILSIYTYAMSRGNNNLSKWLYIGEDNQEKINWSSLVDVASVIIEKQMDKNTVELSFVNTYYEEFSNTIVAKVTLKHDGQSWKVISQEKKDMH